MKSIELEKNRLNKRALVSLTLTLSAFGLPITGIMNHFLSFEAATNGLHTWMAAHNILGLIFMISAVSHVVINRKSISAYLGKMDFFFLPVSREAIIAFLIISVSMGLAMAHAYLT